ncbi:P-type ATPase, cytoplasmic domain N [Pseudocohnilembus persalinus]|uniref:P-type ATPase, cytoplasmic domain N n=1 Tax=Pseudocohnilembus persalinus TaxID=266149 RepID=A0A0V0QA69_PSEPJ|nr:P-type ATPase, cytoplasmic domain N [Pseudocohnilembus persalinus]|eukprot:KRW98967.1 P-type ATPase, cytoplasmic domain N [Pseudocohnilembus persalinus]
MENKSKLNSNQNSHIEMLEVPQKYNRNEISFLNQNLIPIKDAQQSNRPMIQINEQQNKNQENKQLYQKNGEKINKKQLKKNQYLSIQQDCEGQCNIMSIFLLEKKCFKFSLHVFFSVFLLGLPYVLCQHFQQLFQIFYYSQCDNIQNCSHILVKNGDGKFQLLIKQEFEVYAQQLDKQNQNLNQDYQYFKQQNRQQQNLQQCNIQKSFGFMNRYMKYVYDENLGIFKALDTNYIKLTKKEILEQQVMNKQQIEKKLQIYGKGIIDFKLQGLFSFVYYFWTSPNMLLVYLSVLVWLMENMPLAALAMVLAMIISNIVLYLFKWMSEKTILEKSKKIIKVKRFFRNFNNQIESEVIDSDQIVPNDIIEIEPETILTCDLVVIQGEAFINEANITGESDPVPKVQLQKNEKYFSFENDSGSIIYEGSSIINSQVVKRQEFGQNALGNVIRTGFSTKKGQVIRFSLYPILKLSDFQISFLKLTFSLMMVSLLVQFIMFYWWVKDENIPSQFPYIKLGESVITFGAPLVSILSLVSQVTALVRLYLKNIVGNNPNKIYESGNIQMVCFDKTGTITENQVQLNDVWSGKNGFLGLKKYQQVKQQLKQNNLQNNDYAERKVIDNEKNNEKQIKQNQYQAACAENLQQWQNNEQIQRLFACCHQIQQVNLKGQSQIQGDGVDVQMFQVSDFDFYVQEKIQEKERTQLFQVKNRNQDDEILTILKRFEFKSAFASMSVLVEDQNMEQFIFCKGSPEKIISISNQKSVPQNFDKILNELSLKGFRIIGMGYKKIDNQLGKDEIECLEREQAEKELEFLGLLILENQLKSDSKEQFDRLNQSDLKLKIISGDNSLTVINTDKL